MAELGWPGLACPRSGRTGTRDRRAGRLFEEMGYALAPGPLLSNTVAGLALALNGTDEQRPSVAAPAGERREARHGPRSSTPARRRRIVSSRGRPRREMAEYALNGEKIFVLDAAGRRLLPRRRQDGKRRIIVERRGLRPLDRGRRRPIDATRSSYAVKLRRRDGPDEQTPARRRGRDGLLRRHSPRLRRGRGRADRDRAAHDGDGGRLRQGRKQFDRPIGSYQAVSHRCAQMLLETEGARSATYSAAWAADLEPETGALAASMAKAYASDAGGSVTGASLQVQAESGSPGSTTSTCS